MTSVIDELTMTLLDAIPVRDLRNYLDGRLLREQYTGDELRAEVDRLTARADPEAMAYFEVMALDPEADADLMRRTAETLQWMDEVGVDRELSIPMLRNSLRKLRGEEQ